MVLATQGRTKKGIMDRLKSHSKDFQISKHLSIDSIAFIEPKSSDEAIKSLVDRLYRNGVIQEPALFTQSLLAREGQGSTAIGDGIAIPHARIAAYDEFFIAVGLVRSDSLKWDDEHEAIHFVFLIGGPDNCPDDYLQIISHLTRAVKDKEERAKLLSCQTPKDVLRYLLSVSKG